MIILTDDGRLWIPDLGLNTIIEMQPGEGYYTFVSEDVAFSFSELGQFSRRDAKIAEFTEFVENKHGSATQVCNDIIILPEFTNIPLATGLPYAVLVRLSDELKAQNPSVIELYDTDLLVGKAVVSEDCLENTGITPIIAWQGSPEHQLPGFTTGHPITVKVLGSEGEILVDMITIKEKFGEGPYAEITLDGSALAAIPSEFVVGSAYPNPFNPTVTIPFALPRAGEVTITLFNLLGQQVFQTIRTYTAGQHRFDFDASNIGRELVSGMYFLRLQFEDQVHTQKVMLIK